MSMSSTDKALSRGSACATLILLAGIAALPFLPARKSEPPGTGTAAPGTAGSSPTAPVVDAWTDAEVAAELRECVRLLGPVAVDVVLQKPMRQGQCGTPAPLLLRSAGTAAKVVLDPAPMMNCGLAARLSRWVETVLQPAAREVLSTRITGIVGASSYACRNVYNKPDGRLSEHATGNAIDIGAFITADGRTIRVLNGWGPTKRDIIAAQKKAEEAKKQAAAKKTNADEKRVKSKLKPKPDGKSAKKSGGGEKGSLHKAGFTPDGRRGAPVEPAGATLTAAKTAESAFLKRLHRGACAMFGTVLGPEANEAHRNHFHFDAKKRKRRGVCH